MPHASGRGEPLKIPYYHDSKIYNQDKEYRLCCTCKSFSKGIKVDHSHCHNPEGHRDTMRRNGRKRACCHWRSK